MKFFAVLLAVLLLNLAIDHVDAGCGPLCLVCTHGICIIPPGLGNLPLQQQGGYDLGDLNQVDFPGPQRQNVAGIGCSSDCNLCIGPICVIPG